MEMVESMFGNGREKVGGFEGKDWLNTILIYSMLYNLQRKIILQTKNGRGTKHVGNGRKKVV